jgi:chromosome partitioning protein
MANSASEASRLNAKSTNIPQSKKSQNSPQIKEEDACTTSYLFTGKVKEFPLLTVPSDQAGASARVISIVNQKGGVGKTTTTINLGAALAESGRKVLLIDLDSQASMTTGLGIKQNQLKEQYGSIWYLLNDSNANIADFILKSSVPGLDFIRGHKDLAAADAAFVSEIAKEHKLKKMLHPIMNQYDDILIDCSPSLGTLTINALTASTGVLIPMECEYFAILGLSLVKETIEKVKQNTNPNLDVIGILATRFDKKTGHSKDVLNLIATQFPDEVLDSIIARTIKFSESTVQGEPITTFASSNPGATAYRRLARELVFRGGVK